MNLRKMEFNGDYDKADFYARTGMFFAEKRFRKEMPYLINSEEKEWCLFYLEDRLACFYAHEEKDRITYISGFYVLEEYRKLGLTQYMLDDITAHFEQVRMTTCSQHLLKALYDRQFVRVSSRGSYLTLEWTREENR